jgi:predicted esterase
MARRAGVLLALFALGCPGSQRSAAGAPDAAFETSAAPIPAALEPLWEDDWLALVPAEGFRPATVALPRGAREPRPVVVALHGHGDRADWICGSFTGITIAHPFIVCPAGVPLAGTDLWTLGTQEQTEDEIRAAVRGLRKKYGPYVAEGPVVLAGFSLGALRAANMLAADGAFSPNAVLVEGAYDKLQDDDFGRRFASTGGRRVLLACSQPACDGAYTRSLPLLEAAGVQVRAAYSGESTHDITTRMRHTMWEAWPWLVRDVPFWEAWAEAQVRD